MTDTYQPADYTVDQVNEFLDDHPDQTGAVLASEAEGQGRVGILNGRHATPETAPEAPGDAAADPVDLVATSNTQGFHGAVPSQADDLDDQQKVQTVEDAGAAQDTDQADYFGVLPEPQDTAPVPIADLEPQPENLAQTEADRRGYIGTLPSEDDRPDLTLASAAQDAQAQYGDGKPAAS